jgi:hypothetical protein
MPSSTLESTFSLLRHFHPRIGSSSFRSVWSIRQKAHPPAQAGIFEKEITMSVLLITYDSSQIDPDADRVPGIVGVYKHVRISEGAYAIETHERTRTIFNRILPFLHENAHLLVVTLIKPFSGQVRGPASTWLSKHLPEA